MSDGVGCSCYARCASECGCGADWSCGECSKMEERIAEAEAKVAALSSLCAEAATTLIDMVKLRWVDPVAFLDLAAKLIDGASSQGRD